MRQVIKGSGDGRPLDRILAALRAAAQVALGGSGVGLDSLAISAGGDQGQRSGAGEDGRLLEVALDLAEGIDHGAACRALRHVFAGHTQRCGYELAIDEG